MFFRFPIRIISFILFFSYSSVIQETAAGKDNVFTVIIDPGHGGDDTGAISSGVQEKDINLAVALLLDDLIESNHPDVKIVFTRKKDVFIPLNERANIANKAKGDLFISIHANSVPKNKKPYGAETYTLGLSQTEENLEVAMRENSVILLEDDYKQTYEGFDPKSSESYIMFEFMQNKYMDQSVNFASHIQKEFKNTGKRSDRGVKQAGFLVLRETSMPSVLVELGFISNQAERKFLNSSRGKQKMALCIYNAFKQYKKEFDRKTGIIVPNENKYSKDSVKNDDRDPDADKNTNTGRDTIDKKEKKKSASNSKPVYKVQILSSDRKLPANSKRFKGYKNVDSFTEKGVYKYTYGESSDFKEINKIRNSIQKDFKDAFVIRFEDGIKQTSK